MSRRGFLQQAADDLDTLALAGGQRVDGTMRVERESVPGRDFADARGQAGTGAIRLERQRDVLADGQRLEQREVLEHHADAKAPCGGGAGDGDFAAFPEDRSVIRLDDAVDDLHQRRLAGAVLAQHRVNFPGQHGKVDVFVGDDRRISLGDAGEPQARRDDGGGIGHSGGNHARVVRSGSGAERVGHSASIAIRAGRSEPCRRVGRQIRQRKGPPQEPSSGNANGRTATSWWPSSPGPATDRPACCARSCGSGCPAAAHPCRSTPCSSRWITQSRCRRD